MTDRRVKVGAAILGAVTLIVCATLVLEGEMIVLRGLGWFLSLLGATGALACVFARAGCVRGLLCRQVGIVGSLLAAGGLVLALPDLMGCMWPFPFLGLGLAGTGFFLLAIACFLAARGVRGTFFDVAGRVSREEYWRKAWCCFLAQFALCLCLALFAMCCPGSKLVVRRLAFLAFWVPFFLLLPLTVRRLHDRYFSGWWLLWMGLSACIPYLGWIVAGIVCVTVGFLGSKPKEGGAFDE